MNDWSDWNCPALYIFEFPKYSVKGQNTSGQRCVHSELYLLIRDIRKSILTTFTERFATKTKGSL